MLTPFVKTFLLDQFLIRFSFSWFEYLNVYKPERGLKHKDKDGLYKYIF